MFNLENSKWQNKSTYSLALELFTLSHSLHLYVHWKSIFIFMPFLCQFYRNIWYFAVWILVTAEFTVRKCTEVTLKYSFLPCPLLLFGNSCWSRDRCDRLSHAYTVHIYFTILLLLMLLWWWNNFTNPHWPIFTSCFQRMTTKLTEVLDLKTCWHWPELMEWLCRNMFSCMFFEKEAVNTKGEASLREYRSGHTMKDWGQRGKSGMCLPQLWWELRTRVHIVVGRWEYYQHSIYFSGNNNDMLVEQISKERGQYTLYIIHFYIWLLLQTGFPSVYRQRSQFSLIDVFIWDLIIYKIIEMVLCFVFLRQIRNLHLHTKRQNRWN